MALLLKSSVIQTSSGKLGGPSIRSSTVQSLVMIRREAKRYKQASVDLAPCTNFLHESPIHQNFSALLMPAHSGQRASTNRPFTSTRSRRSGTMAGSAAYVGCGGTPPGGAPRTGWKNEGDLHPVAFTLVSKQSNRQLLT